MRVVQELLGHASVTTTQIYTLVTVDQLREVYAGPPPRAALTARADRRPRRPTLRVASRRIVPERRARHALDRVASRVDDRSRA